MPRHKKVVDFSRYSLAPINTEDAIQRAYGIGIEAARSHLDAKDRLHLLFHATLSSVQSELATMSVKEKLSLLSIVAPYTQKQIPKTIETKEQPRGQVDPEQAKKELAAMSLLMDQESWDQLNAERERMLLTGADGSVPIDAQLVIEGDTEDTESAAGDEDE